MTRRVITVLDAVTATTTSSAYSVRDATKITFLFTRADHTSGSSAFTVEGSVDGTTYVGLNKLISNSTNTNGQTLTRVATVTLSSDTSSVASLDLEYDIFSKIRVTVTETTDGTHTCKMLIEE